MVHSTPSFISAFENTFCMNIASKISTKVKNLRELNLQRMIFIIVISLFLCAPVLSQLIAKNNDNALDENRALASLPALPRSLQEAFKFPAATEVYLNDHFGFRKTLVEWNNKARFYLLHETNSSQITLGDDGFIFLNSHAADQPLLMINFLCGKGVSQQIKSDLAKQVTSFVKNASQINQDSLLVFVPTKPILYQDKLPGWIRKQCAPYENTLSSIMGQLDRNLHNKIVYPIDFMMDLKRRTSVYPKENFHWDGSGPRPIAEQISNRYFHVQKSSTLTMHEEIKASDLQRFLPGITLNVQLQMPAYGDSEVNACAGGKCFPEFGEIAEKLGDLSRFKRNHQRGPKLLLISDSFGSAIAGYFIESFGEVWHISINNINSLSPIETAKLRSEIYKKYQPDSVLYIFHDFSIACFSTVHSYCPVNLNTILPENRFSATDLVSVQ